MAHTRNFSLLFIFQLCFIVLLAREFSTTELNYENTTQPENTITSSFTQPTTTLASKSTTPQDTCYQAHSLNCTCEPYEVKAGEKLTQGLKVECVRTASNVVGIGRVVKMVLQKHHWPILPPTLNTYPSLVNLDLQFNNISLLAPFAFANLSNLLTLDLSYNNIVSLDQYSLVGLSSLQTFNLEYNHMFVIQSNIFTSATTPNLLSLSMRGCSVVLVEKGSFTGLQHLHVIDLSHNNIRNIESLASTDHPLSSLRILNLTINKINTLPDDLLQNTPSLQHILLAYNFLTFVSPHDFTYVRTTLTSLNLHGNLIDQINSKSFRSLSQLTSLDLSLNFITQLKLKTLPDPPNLNLTIHHNPLDCGDCENAWMVDTSSWKLHPTLAYTNSLGAMFCTKPSETYFGNITSHPPIFTTCSSIPREVSQHRNITTIFILLFLLLLFIITIMLLMWCRRNRRTDQFIDLRGPEGGSNVFDRMTKTQRVDDHFPYHSLST